MSLSKSALVSFFMFIAVLSASYVTSLAQFQPARRFVGHWSNVSPKKGDVSRMVILRIRDSENLRIRYWTLSDGKHIDKGWHEAYRPYGYEGLVILIRGTTRCVSLKAKVLNTIQLATPASHCGDDQTPTKLLEFRRRKRAGAFPPEPNLWSGQACQKIGNIEGAGPVECLGPGGRNFGKSGTTFRSGDPIVLLLRFRDLPIGDHKVILEAEHKAHISGEFEVASSAKDVFNFKNTGEAWSVWSEAKGVTSGEWQITVILDGRYRGTFQYCVDCIME